MRVVEPHQFKGRPKKRQSNGRVVVVVVVLISLVGAGAFVYTRQNNNDSTNTTVASNATSNDASSLPAPQPKTGALKQFTGEEFKKLYQSIARPNLQSIDPNLAITGNEVADVRIKKLAEERGYQLSAIPQGAIIKINEPRLNGDDLLQPLAASSWTSMKEAAQKDGYPLSIVSAYRSPEYQRNLFMERLLANGTTAKFIADGIGDPAINRTLEMTAVPGYSRHHTGYTIDLWCEDGSGSFRASSCYRWISENNYLHAKEHGWIPSYPEGTDLQGPEPEPWEYVWVGTDVLRD